LSTQAKEQKNGVSLGTRLDLKSMYTIVIVLIVESAYLVFTIAFNAKSYASVSYSQEPKLY